MEVEDLQTTAHSYAIEGKSFFLTGSAGTGKTYTLCAIIKSLKEQNKRVAVTACTGIAAQHFGSDATTIHSFAGFSFEENLFLPSRSKWNNFDVLIVDEISMLSSTDFKAIEKCAQLSRNNELPMGGIQIIGCGDFFQLPPTYSNTPKPGRDGQMRNATSLRKTQSRNNQVNFAFYTSRWDAVFPIIVNLTKVHRQKHHDFIEILNKIRSSEFLEGVHEYLIKNCSNKFNPNVPYIFATNKQVNRINNNNAESLKSFVVYTDKSGKIMKLAVGVPVIGLINNFQMRNGSRGVIVGFNYQGMPYDLAPGINNLTDVHPVVKFNGYNEQTTVKIDRSDYFPITYAWAMTIHKAQGMTFESLNVDVSECLSAGHVYVALSRVPDPSQMNLSGYNDSLVKRGSFVNLFYRSYQPIKRIPGDPE